MLSSTYDILLCIFFWSYIVKISLVSNVLKDFIDFHVDFDMDFSVYFDLKPPCRSAWNASPKSLECSLKFVSHKMKRAQAAGKAGESSQREW